MFSYTDDVETNITMNSHYINDIIFAYVRNPIWEKLARQISTMRRYIGITRNFVYYGMDFQKLLGLGELLDITEDTEKWHRFWVGQTFFHVGPNRNRAIYHAGRKRIQGIMIQWKDDVTERCIYIYHCTSCGELMQIYSNSYLCCKNPDCMDLLVIR